MLKSIRKNLHKAILVAKFLKEINETFNPTTKEVLFYTDGLPVVLANEALEYKFNIPKHFPGAMITQKIKGTNYIMVNDGLLKAPKHILEAIIQHEVGHVKCKHLSGAVAIYKNLRHGRNINHEFEADLYSQKTTGNMIEALEYLKSHRIYNNSELNLRIDMLKESL